jgi:hypothetical protein
MKTTPSIVLLALAAISCGAPELPVTVKEAAPTELRGPYLGQDPPGETPQVFAPGFVSTGLYERDLAMLPDGSEFYFCVVIGNFDRSVIMVTRQDEDGRWSEPEVAGFSGRYHDLEPAITPDGKRFYFSSRRPIEPGGEELDKFDIWYMDRNGDRWEAPQRLGMPINTGDAEFFPSLTADGTLYFTRQFDRVDSVIMRAPATEDGFGMPERLGEGVNDRSTQFNAYVAPDESYLIFGAVGRDDSIGGVDYYVSFRNEDGSWRGPFNLGPRINTVSHLEYSPYVSPDGNYFFFMAARSRLAGELHEETLDRAKIVDLYTSPRNGMPDIWWVDAGFLERLRVGTE